MAHNSKKSKWWWVANVRGFEANRILLVVDGVKLNNTIYRSGYLQNILSVDPYVLENISVLHGPSSVFYGSGSLGGPYILNTINIEKLEENKSSFTQQFEKFFFFNHHKFL